MGKKVNPGVDDADEPELEGPDLVDPGGPDDGEVTPQDTADDEQEQPIAGAAEATARRSRRAKDEEPGKAPVNLDDLPEFRQWKSKSDRDLDALRKRLQETERREAEREAQWQQQQVAQLAANLDGYEDPTQKQAAIEQIAALRAAGQFKQWQSWARHVDDEAKKAGLDPTDFDPTQYTGSEGAAQFRADLAEAKAAKLERERKELAEKASPDAIAKIVKAELAKLRQAQGLDDVDTGEATPAGETDLKRDMKLLNSGRLTPAEFRKRHGG